MTTLRPGHTRSLTALALILALCPSLCVMPMAGAPPVADAAEHARHQGHHSGSDSSHHEGSPSGVVTTVAEQPECAAGDCCAELLRTPPPAPGSAVVAVSSPVVQAGEIDLLPASIERVRDGWPDFPSGVSPPRLL